MHIMQMTYGARTPCPGRERQYDMNRDAQLKWCMHSLTVAGAGSHDAPQKVQEACTCFEGDKRMGPVVAR
eukprot:55671-Eustigmatos_ZCMA.PRE.1